MGVGMYLDDDEAVIVDSGFWTSEAPVIYVRIVMRPEDKAEAVAA